jgi:hypothetical protein
MKKITELGVCRTWGIRAREWQIEDRYLKSEGE